MPHFEINGFHSFFKDKFCSRFKLLSKWLELWTESLIVLHLTNTHSQIYHLLFVLFIIVCRQATFKQVIWRAKQNACHVKVATSFWSWHCFYQQAGHNIVTYTHTHTNHWYTVCVCVWCSLVGTWWLSINHPSGPSRIARHSLVNKTVSKLICFWAHWSWFCLWALDKGDSRVYA